MASETYGTKAPVILALSGVKGAAGGGGGSGSAVMSEKMLDPDDATNFPTEQIGTTGRYAWQIETNVKNEENVGIADSFNYTVYLKKVVPDTGDPVIIHNPLVQIADSADYNPVYVSAASLIYTDTNMILEVLYERGATSIIFDNDGNYIDIQWGEYDDDKTTN